jgi:hypothetical protein
MAKVLIAWELGGGLGHCAKLVPIASELLNAGHEVYFAGRDVTTVRKLLPSPEIRILQSPCLLSAPVDAIRQPRTFAHILQNVGFGDDDQLRSLIVSWRSLFDLVRPDALICEHAPTALLASRWISCRRIVIGTGFSLPPDVSPLPDMCPWMKVPAIDIHRHESILRDRINRLLTNDRIAPLKRLSEFYGDADEHFLATFSELDHYRERAAAEYWGNWSLKLGAEAQPSPLTDRPRVFAYLKPSAGPWKLEHMLGLLRGLPFETFAYVPPGRSAIKKFESAALRISFEPVDLATQLGNCDLAILHGTAGTSTQCLLAGVPLLMVPLVLEQAIFSRRIVELGAGLMAAPHRAEQFASKLWMLLHNDRYRNAAQAFAAQYETHDANARQRSAIERIKGSLTVATPASSLRHTPVGLK